jgi:hypothetical protein
VARGRRTRWAHQRLACSAWRPCGGARNRMHVPSQADGRDVWHGRAAAAHNHLTCYRHTHSCCCCCCCCCCWVHPAVKAPQTAAMSAGRKCCLRRVHGPRAAGRRAGGRPQGGHLGLWRHPGAHAQRQPALCRQQCSPDCPEGGDAAAAAGAATACAQQPGPGPAAAGLLCLRAQGQAQRSGGAAAARAGGS